MLLTVIDAVFSEGVGNQKTLHRQIQCQFQGKRHIPFTATAEGKKHGRDTIWEMRALAEGFREAVGSSRSHQGELAWRELDHRDDHHHRDPQRPSGATGPLLPHQPADQARSPATTDPPALVVLLRRSLAATRTSGIGRGIRSCTRTLTATPTATERLCFRSCARW